VAAGVLIGPMALKLITDMSSVSILGELGVAFLLFVAGMELDFRRIKSVGKSSVIGGVIQICITFFIGVFLVAFLGMDPVIGIYIGLLFAFSSTMIVAKFLVDKNEVDTLHGRTMLSILLIQDIVAILALTFITRIGVDAFMPMAWVIGGVSLLFVGTYVLNRFVFPHLMEYAAESKEMLFFTSIAVCFLFMGFAYGMGISIAIGAFIAGISLAGLPYNVEISSELTFVRDFFAVLFFASLGMQLNPMVISQYFDVFLLFLAVLMIAKPVILSLTYLSMGYGLRASVDTGVGMGQASEFSFILAAVGLGIGHLSHDIYSLIISVVVISMLFTPYMMRSRKKIHSLLKARGADKKFKARYLQKLQRLPGEGMKDHVILVGGGVTGRKVTDYLAQKKKKFVIVERNPDVARLLAHQGYYTVFGEACHEDVLNKAGLASAKIFIITIPDMETSLFAVKEARRSNKRLRILVRAHTARDAKDFKDAGANFMIVPELISGEGIIREMDKYL